MPIPLPQSPILLTGLYQSVYLQINADVYDRLLVSNISFYTLDISCGQNQVRLQPNTVDLLRIDGARLDVNPITVVSTANPQLQLQAVRVGEELTETYPLSISSGSLSPTFSTLTVTGTSDLQGTTTQDGPWQSKSKPWYDSTHPAYGGGAGPAVVDNAPRINLAAIAAGVTGGWVILPIDTGYPVRTSIILPTGVTLMGFSSYLGMTMGDVTLLGSILLPQAAGGAFDVIQTKTPGTVKGGGVCGIAVDGGTTNANWALHIFDAVGFIVQNFSMRNGAFNGFNGVLLDAQNSGFQCRFSEMCLSTGFGFIGGTGFKLGGLGPANANKWDNLQILGFALGIDDNNGGGNTGIATWCQSCTVGTRFNSSQSGIKGGWYEANVTADVRWGVGAVFCYFENVRCPAGPVKVLDDNVPVGSGRNRVSNVDGFHVGAIAVATTLAAVGSGVNFTNPNWCDCLFVLIPGGGAITVVTVDGVVTGLVGACTVPVPCGSIINVTFTPGATWTWFGLGG